MKITPELIERYYKKLCTPEEIRRVEHWIEHGDEGEPADFPLNENKAENKRLIWEQLQHDLLAADRHLINRKRDLTTWLSIAASIILISGIAAYLVLSQTSRKLSSPAAIAYRTVCAAKGQKIQVKLSDGTVVRLNSGSELRYPLAFTDSSRSVSLVGEGFFEVAKDPSRPFTILAGNSQTRVLGTVFDLKCYPGEAITLAVTEGKVRFGGNATASNGLFMAGQVGLLTPEGKLSRPAADASLFSNWTQNRLVFRNESLATIIPVLERWYNIKINLKDPSLKHQTLNATFDNPLLTYLLDRIAFMLRIKYKLHQRTVTLSQ
jgi:transmembrane sensor